MPALYTSINSRANAFTGGVDAPYVAVTSALLDSMTDDEVLAVLAHELAHYQSGIVLYKMAARLLGHGRHGLAKVTLGIGNLVMVPLPARPAELGSLLGADRRSRHAAGGARSRDCAAVLMAGWWLRPLRGQSCRWIVLWNRRRARRAGEEDVMSRIFTHAADPAWRSPSRWRAAELWRWAAGRVPQPCCSPRPKSPAAGMPGRAAATVPAGLFWLGCRSSAISRRLG